MYCGERESTTPDHVWGRGFCLEQYRDNLPQVPACGKCNGEKSTLEHYLMTVLPFGCQHRDSQATLKTLVPKRLEKNAKLYRELQIGYIGDKLPLRENSVEPLFKYVAKGLVWHHWGAILTPQDCAAAIVVRSDGLGFLGYLLTKLRPRDRVVGNLGNGALLYQGIQATDCPQLTMWVFSIYGGLCFGESSHDPNGKHSIIFAITGPRTLLPNFWTSVFKEELPAA